VSGEEEVWGLEGLPMRMDWEERGKTGLKRFLKKLY